MFRITVIQKIVRVVSMAVLSSLYIAMLLACQPSMAPTEVVIYTSVDQPYAEDILVRFEQATGTRVRALYDVEAAKTTGLVNRLVAEKDNPTADVFWNNEIIHTLRLREEGVLQPYISKESISIPVTYADPQGYWVGNAARARVLLLNTDRMPYEPGPVSMQDLLDPKIPPKEIGIAYPLFGTSATHAAALYELYGRESALDFYRRLAQNGVRVVDGNSVVRDLVASGQLSIGVTDTDDACGAVRRGNPVRLVLPDQDGIGTLVIPSTVSILAGAPHLKQAKELVDFLLKADTEQALLDAQYSQIPLHVGLKHNSKCPLPEEIKGMQVDYDQVYKQLEPMMEDLRSVFIR